MKLINDEVEVEEIGEFNSIDSSIAPENLGLALKMVSKNLYSNPIGSFIRELTSNAVDANVDAEEENPVIVHVYKEEDLEFIEVKDNGTGMSPEIFKNIYMSWFNSDKRNTNDKIGGWGLGSKSPLSYQDSFEIITRFDGIKYTYLFANEGDLPVATLISEEETNESNGTTIRVEIKEQDSYKVFKECKSQLTYFDNVYVKHEEYFYDNSFKIYESEDFKLRNKSFPFSNDMHICLRQVAYPINWNVLGFDDPIRIPVGIKFDIGELEVTLSREEISYTEKVKEVLINKINKVHEQLIKKYEEQLKVDDLFKYLKLLNNNTKPPLKIEDVEISMSQSKANLFFAPFEGVKIKSEDVLSIFSCYNVSKLKGGRKYDLKSGSYTAYFNLRTYPARCYLVSKSLNYYDTLYIENGFLFKRGKLTPQRFRKLCTLLGLVHKKNRNTVDHYSNSEYRRLVDKSIIKQGASKIIHKVIKYVDEYLHNNIESYDGIAPKEWIEDIKTEKALVKESTKGEITYYSMDNRRSKIKLSSLIENNKAVFYIDRKEENEKIEAYYNLYEHTNKFFQENTSFLIVSTTVIKSLKRFDTCMQIENIFKWDMLRKSFYRYKLRHEVGNLVQYSGIFDYSKYYNTKYNKLLSTYKDSHLSFNPYKYFKDIIDSIKTKDDYFIHEEYIKELKEFAKKAEILKYLKSNTPQEFILKIIKKDKLFKLNSYYYDRSENVKAKLLMEEKLNSLREQMEYINNPNI